MSIGNRLSGDFAWTKDLQDRVTLLRAQPSNLRIAGVALLLFSGVLLGVGIHHLIATGTCSSTGYSANYGPVPTCPSGTGWWFAFVFGGVIGGLIGALMAGSLGLVFAGLFGAIGFGALSILFDSHTQSGEKVFGAPAAGSQLKATRQRRSMRSRRRRAVWAGLCERPALGVAPVCRDATAARVSCDWWPSQIHHQGEAGCAEH
jgi:hypothetical protein